MTILCDSREKWTQPNSTDTHIRDWFDRHGIEWEVRKLDVGDYMTEGNPLVSVDRKQSLEELSRNLMNRSDASRFWREVRRAHEQHIKLVVLIECGRTVKTVPEIAKWHSKYSPVSGRRLLDEMIRCEMAYGVVFRICDRRSTGRVIVEILTQKVGDEPTNGAKG